jgi:hypothetical protein
MKLNKPQLMSLGYLEACERQPRFSTQQEKRQDYSKNAADLKVLIDAGVPLKPDEVYAKIGYTEPGPADPTLKTIAKPTPASPFGGGGPGLPPPDMNSAPPTETPGTPMPPKPEGNPNV